MLGGSTNKKTLLWKCSGTRRGLKMKKIFRGWRTPAQGYLKKSKRVWLLGSKNIKKWVGTKNLCIVSIVAFCPFAVDSLPVFPISSLVRNTANQIHDMFCEVRLKIHDLLKPKLKRFHTLDIWRTHKLFLLASEEPTMSFEPYELKSAGTWLHNRHAAASCQATESICWLKSLHN